MASHFKDSSQPSHSSVHAHTPEQSSDLEAAATSSRSWARTTTKCSISGSQHANQHIRKPSSLSVSTKATANSTSSPVIPATGVSSDAPRPITQEAALTGEFKTLDAHQGAVVHDRNSAGEAAHAARNVIRKNQPQRMRRASAPRVRDNSAFKAQNKGHAFIGVGVAAVAILCLFAVALYALLSPSTSLTGDTSRPEQAQTDTNGFISYDGYNYGTQQNSDGSYAFARSTDNGEDLVLFDLEGTPATCILYKSAFLIPQNTQDGYNVIAWTMGDGSDPLPLTDASGAPVQGSQSVSAASIADATLTLTLSDGSVQTVPLN